MTTKGTTPAEESADLEPVVYGDRYEVVRELGSGGASTVYLAIDSVKQRRVAIKKLIDPVHWDEDKAERFHQEFEALSEMHHPGIVRVLDKGLHEGTPFFVMEYLAGYSLEELIDGEAPNKHEILGYLHVFEEIFRTLSYIHGRGVIHRDISPSNIRLVPGIGVKLVDFGLAKIQATEGPQNDTDEIMGTAAYMSPEQGRGDAVDARSDLYSVGICFYHAVTGQLPFEDINPIMLAVRHDGDMPSVPSFLNPEVPSNIEELIIKLMEKNPEKRYPSADTVLQIVEQKIHGQDPDGEIPSVNELLVMRLGEDAVSRVYDTLNETYGDTVLPGHGPSGHKNGFGIRSTIRSLLDKLGL